MNIFSQEKIVAIEELNSKLLNKNSSPNNNIIFVYCPPKVGSTTLVSSIRLSAAQKFNVIHIHDETLFSAISENQNVHNIKVDDIVLYNKTLGKNVYVIDIFRSPVERKISEFFEQIGTLHFNNSEKNINNYNVKKVISRFNSLFPYLGNSDYYKERYNLPYLPETFDFDNKYLLCESNGIKYIKLRLKDSACWGNILTNLLGVKIVIINDYETDKKPLAGLFTTFKQTYEIPENFLEIINSCPGLLFYYTPSERQEYIDSWNLRKTNTFDSYTHEQYVFYTQLCLENQSQNVIQVEHYIDVGCLCLACSIKRAKLFALAKNGQKITEKIVHTGAVNEIKGFIDRRNRLVQEKVNKLNSRIRRQTLNGNKVNFGGSKVVKKSMNNIIESNKQ